MKIKAAKDYEGKKFHFPSDSLPQKQKDDKKYFEDAAKAIVGKYVNNLCSIGYSKNSISVLRDYANGDQSIEFYKDILIGQRGENGKRRNHTWNINWKKLDILPKKLQDVLSYMLKINYDVVVKAIDSLAVEDRETLMAAAKLSTDDKMKFLHEELNNLAGGQAVSPDGQLVGQMAGVPFKDEHQVEMAEKVGTFALQVEAALETLINTTLNKSNSPILEYLWKKDLVELNMAAKITSVNGDMVLEKHLKLDRLIIPYSELPDASDRTWEAYLDTVTIADLIKSEQFTDDEIMEIAEKYNGLNSDANTYIPNLSLAVQESRANNLGMAVLHSIPVDVAYCYWIGNKSLCQTSIVRDKDGVLSVNTVSEDHELSTYDHRKGKKLNKYTWQTVYKATLILGTQKVHNYGIENDIRYEKDDKGKMCAKLPIDFIKIPGKSLTEKCMGFVDDLHIALYKKRKLMKGLGTGPNIKINKAAFENVRIDNKVYTPRELMNLFTDEGFLIVDDKNPFGDPNRSGSRPIDTISTDVFQRMMQLNSEIEFNTRMIEEVTGINPTFSAKQPSSETGLGVSKIALQATENSIYQIVECHRLLTSAGHKTKAEKWKIVARNLDESKRDKLILDNNLKYLRIGKNIGEHEYDISVEAGVTENEKLALMQEVTQLTDLRRQAGSGGITPSDKLLIFNFIKSGNINKAQLMLSQIEEIRANEDEAKAQKRYEENAKLQAQSNQQASENKQQELMMEGQIKSNVKDREIQGQLMLEEVKSTNARKLAAIQNIWGWGLDKYKETVK